MAAHGWQAAEEAADRASSGIFIKMENDGDKVTLFFMSEPYTYEVLWDGAGYTPFTKEHEAAGKKPSFKYKFNCYVPAEAAVKIYECSVQVFKDILAVKKKYGLTTKTFEIVRKGKKGDTKTTYTVLPDNDLTAEQRAVMDKLPLHNLEAARDDDTKPGDGKTNTGGFESFKGKEGVVDAKIAEQLMARLKVLPRAQIDKFLARFGIEKIKQLKGADAEIAGVFVAWLEGKGPNPDEKPAAAAAPAEKDPFAD